MKKPSGADSGKVSEEVGLDGSADGSEVVVVLVSRGSCGNGIDGVVTVCGLLWVWVLRPCAELIDAFAIWFGFERLLAPLPCTGSLFNGLVFGSLDGVCGAKSDRVIVFWA